MTYPLNDLGLVDARQMLRSVVSECWTPREPMNVDEWADRYRELTSDASDEPGPWRTDRVPYLREPMRCFTEPGVKLVVLMFGSQLGKTEAMFNCLGYTIDHDPYPSMMVYPNSDIAAAMNKRRFLPSVKASARLRRHLTGRSWDEKSLEIIFDTMVLSLVGANSPANLASRPIGRVFGDEIDKWPERTGGKEGAAVDLLLQRLDAFADGKAFLPSTPTDLDVGVHRLYKLSDQARYFVPCPHCGEHQTLEFHTADGGGVHWEGGVGRDLSDTDHAALVERVRMTAWMQCKKCGQKMENHHKPAMLAGGQWVRRGQSVNDDGEIDGVVPPSTTRGFQLSKLYSPWRTFGDVASRFVARHGEPDRAFVNGDLGEPWVTPGQRTDHESLLKYARQLADGETPYRIGEVPAGVLVLTGAIDVQEDEVWIEVVGWGEHERRWLISYDCVPCPRLTPGGPKVKDAQAMSDRAAMIEDLKGDAWAHVSAYMRDAWPKLDAHGKMSDERIKVSLWAIDSGHRTKEVYDFVRLMGPSVTAVKGESGNNLPHRLRVIDRMSDGKAIAGGVECLFVNGDHWKDDVSQRAHRRPPQYGAWSWPADLGTDYARQFTAEERVLVKGKYVWRVRPGRANHLFDCAVYNMALADWRGLRDLRSDGSDDRGLVTTGKTIQSQHA